MCCGDQLNASRIADTQVVTPLRGLWAGSRTAAFQLRLSETLAEGGQCLGGPAAPLGEQCDRNPAAEGRAAIHQPHPSSP